MRLFSKIILIVILGCFITSPLFAKREVKEAVVKIYTVYNEYDYYDPWQMSGQRRRSGSGCIISGNRILTNAHVVGDQTFLQVRRAGEAKRYIAEVEIVAHECELAILKVKDDTFFSGIRSLDMGNLPEVRDRVAVYGFPRGGDELCITEGVVSRVEHQRYTHSQAYLLTCQIDAAINPGSSGGPVIKDGKIVGVAFQAGSGENIGYMVPVPVINHFLKDVEDGKYDGIPGLGVSWQKMENPDLRAKLNMTERETGILVNKIYPGSPTRGILKSGDIILSIDGRDIANDGTIEFRKDERTSWGYLAQKKYINDPLSFEILREKEIRSVEIRLSLPLDTWRLVPNAQYDVAPTYYILGGLVFEPLTRNFLKEWGREWWGEAPRNLVNYYYEGEPTEERREVIVLVKVLADEVNVGYYDWRYNVISYINGKKISTMKDLVSAFEDYEGSYHTIVDERGYEIVLERDKIQEANQRILKKYKINSDRSEDLRSF
ncbi:trypsin-like peptidase domain-containing protein [bacterium]|nr:trypsin-like peptidase domain-containing protein [bacterium]